MIENKLNILLIPSDTSGGVFYYRIYNWSKRMMNTSSNRVNIIIPEALNLKDKDWLIENKIDIIYFHNGLFSGNEQLLFWEWIDFAKSKGIKLVMDIDDYVDWGKNHIMYEWNREMLISERLIVNLYKSDYITTTTEYYKEKLEKITRKNNVFVFRNCIDKNSVEQWNINKTESKRLRFGLAGGVSHGKDNEQLVSILRKLPKQYLDKIQLVLVGYNTKKGTVLYWPELENKLTINKSICSSEYREYLLKNYQDDSNETINDDIYRRITVKKIYDIENRCEGDFGKVYNDIDVVLVPLQPSEFNNYKSELKFVEAGFTNTGIIFTNTGPYKKEIEKYPILKDLSIGIDYTKGINGWVKAIKLCVDNKEKLFEMRKKMSDFIIDEYDIDKENEKRISFFEKIVNFDSKNINFNSFEHLDK